MINVEGEGGAVTELGTKSESTSYLHSRYLEKINSINSVGGFLVPA